MPEVPQPLPPPKEAITPVKTDAKIETSAANDNQTETSDTKKGIGSKIKEGFKNLFKKKDQPPTTHLAMKDLAGENNDADFIQGDNPGLPEKSFDPALPVIAPDKPAPVDSSAFVDMGENPGVKNELGQAKDLLDKARHDIADARYGLKGLGRSVAAGLGMDKFGGQDLRDKDQAYKDAEKRVKDATMKDLNEKLQTASKDKGEDGKSESDILVEDTIRDLTAGEFTRLQEETTNIQEQRIKDGSNPELFKKGFTNVLDKYRRGMDAATAAVIGKDAKRAKRIVGAIVVGGAINMAGNIATGGAWSIVSRGAGIALSTERFARAEELKAEGIREAEQEETVHVGLSAAKDSEGNYNSDQLSAYMDSQRPAADKFRINKWATAGRNTSAFASAVALNMAFRSAGQFVRAEAADFGLTSSAHTAESGTDKFPPPPPPTGETPSSAGAEPGSVDAVHSPPLAGETSGLSAPVDAGNHTDEVTSGSKDSGGFLDKVKTQASSVVNSLDRLNQMPQTIAASETVSNIRENISELNPFDNDSPASTDSTSTEQPAAETPAEKPNIHTVKSGDTVSGLVYGQIKDQLQGLSPEDRRSVLDDIINAHKDAVPSGNPDKIYLNQQIDLAKFTNQEELNKLIEDAKNKPDAPIAQSQPDGTRAGSGSQGAERISDDEMTRRLNTPDSAESRRAMDLSDENDRAEKRITDRAHDTTHKWLTDAMKDIPEDQQKDFIKEQLYEKSAAEIANGKYPDANTPEARFGNSLDSIRDRAVFYFDDEGQPKPGESPNQYLQRIYQLGETNKVNLDAPDPLKVKTDESVIGSFKENLKSTPVPDSTPPRPEDTGGYTPRERDEFNDMFKKAEASPPEPPVESASEKPDATDSSSTDKTGAEKSAIDSWDFKTKGPLTLDSGEKGFNPNESPKPGAQAPIDIAHKMGYSTVESYTVDQNHVVTSVNHEPVSKNILNRTERVSYVDNADLTNLKPGEKGI